MESLSFYKDYTEKLKNKLPEQEATDINNLIVFLNYCFMKRNNFFVNNFNKKTINGVCTAYNLLKTHILKPNDKNIFDNINIDGLKSIRFIILNAVNNYSIIKDNNTELCSIISRESLKRCLIILNKQIIQQ